MISNLCIVTRGRRWGTVAVVAGAAFIGTGVPTACADDGALASDIGLLTTSEIDLNDGLTAISQIPGASAPPVPADYGTLIGQFEAAQTPLLSSDNNVISGVGEVLFNGPDQQLAQASDSFLTAAQAFAGDPTSAADQFSVISATFGFTGSLLGDSLPANILGEFVDKAFGLGGAEPTTSAAAAMSDPAPALAHAASSYTDANQLLGEIPSGEFVSVSGAIFNQNVDIQDIASLGVSENALLSYDNGAFADFFNPVFASVNQGWDQASQSALSADQALETAVASGSTADTNTAILGLIEPSYQSFVPDIDSTQIDLFAHLLTGVDPFTASVAAADPASIADVLSSIGL